MSLYHKRGVSAQKEEVHAAIKQLSAGLYPHAFCKIFPDFIGKDDRFVNLMHADGAGTKSILAYLYWKETGDVSVWKGIAQDAVIMNLDDLLCVGVYDDILFNSTIDRNKKNIPGEVLEAIITGTRELFERLQQFGTHIHYLGGETADVGDVVRTIAVNGTMTARWSKDKLITNEKISVGDVIVGFASYGRAIYETEYNSGIGSNGLTSARHDMLSKYYARFTESFEPSLEQEVVYIGKYRLTDPVEIEGYSSDIGKMLLSPTRTYAPLVQKLLQSHFDKVHGLIHSSGGGQTKCLKYLPGNMRIVKDDLFAPPMIFEMIRESSGADNREMYQVFNMGCRLEIFCSEKDADTMLHLGKELGIEARVIGKVEASDRQELLIRLPQEELYFSK
jgi:phosphoribosylformylglycinamidine cyclo-ligase